MLKVHGFMFWGSLTFAAIWGVHLKSRSHVHDFKPCIRGRCSLCWSPDEVGISLGYKTATAQAGLKFMTAHFETNALLSGQYCNIPAVLRHSRERLHAKHECIGWEDKIKRNKTHTYKHTGVFFFFLPSKKNSHIKKNWHPTILSGLTESQQDWQKMIGKSWCPADYFSISTPLNTYHNTFSDGKN